MFFRRIHVRWRIGRNLDRLQDERGFRPDDGDGHLGCHYRSDGNGVHSDDEQQRTGVAALFGEARVRSVDEHKLYSL
jgi:hypothetical protein